jgi:hypothetical protein
MNNLKYKMMDFYLVLLQASDQPNFQYDWLADHVRNALAVELDTNPRNVQNIFEQMVKEDDRIINQN